MQHPIREILNSRRQKIKCGIASYCSTNELVLENALKRAILREKPVLIEATANQVNQLGGYTGMTPDMFYQKVMNMADAIGVSGENIILGGDHLGPLTWKNERECEAMPKACDLVYQYARAGFTKIHLDTSMKLKDDPDGPLSTKTIARRGVHLYQSSMKGYEDLLKVSPDAMRPVFVIGSEVPIPGGSQEIEDTLNVTKAEAFEETVRIYQQCFEEAGIRDGFSDVIAVVVQPGVEFGDEQIFMYDRAAASSLCGALKKYPELCFEGHSTDYQSVQSLKEMTEDGIAILKVGPALTYALREACFALCQMERELVPELEQSHFIENLEAAMINHPEEWDKHYHGNEAQLRLKRKYSFSDRSRYYLGTPQVIRSTDTLFANLRRYAIPLSMLHQFIPNAYPDVRDGKITMDPKALVMSGITAVMMEYEFAAD